MAASWAGLAGYVSLLVALPMLALVVHALAEGLGPFWASVTGPVAVAALRLTVGTSLLVAAIDMVAGTATAWVLVRHRFPGRGFLSALVDLPLAIPTLVAGLTIAVLYGPGSALEDVLGGWGISVLFAPSGIVLALLFVTLPFVVRGVVPVLLEIDPSEEEAALILGASARRVFTSVHLPAIAPAVFSGGMRAFGRAMGEFGAVVIVAGNIPFATLTAPVYVFGEVESGASGGAAALSVVLLTVALALHVASRLLERRIGARRAGG